VSCKSTECDGMSGNRNRVSHNTTLVTLKINEWKGNWTRILISRRCRCLSRDLEWVVLRVDKNTYPLREKNDPLTPWNLGVGLKFAGKIKIFKIKNWKLKTKIGKNRLKKAPDLRTNLWRFFSSVWCFSSLFLKILVFKSLIFKILDVFRF
jgi:hypothetical protein